MTARTVANLGVASIQRYVEQPGEGETITQVSAGIQSFPQLKVAVIEDGAVQVLVGVDSSRRVLVEEKLADTQREELRSYTPARVALADGTWALVQNAGCGCGSPLKGMDVAEVYGETR